jgi:hypothetical protein
MKTKFDKVFNTVIHECKSTKKVVKESADTLPVNADRQSMKMTEFINYLNKLEANCGFADPQIRFIYINEKTGDRTTLFLPYNVSFYTNEDNETIDVEISFK